MAFSKNISLFNSKNLCLFRQFASACPGKDDKGGKASSLNPNLETALNKQLNAELVASYKYMTLQAYFSHHKVALKGFAKLQDKSIKEELRHAKVLMDLINMRGGQVRFQEIPNPEPQTWSSVPDALKYALSIEEGALKGITELQTLANELKDYYVGDKIQKGLGEDTIKSLSQLNEYIAQLENDKTNNLIYILDKELNCTK